MTKKGTEEIIKKAKELIKNKKSKEAIELLSNEIESDPENADLIAELGHVYFFDIKQGKAEENFKLALSKDPNNVSALRGIGLIHVFRNNMNQAITTYSKLIEINPEDVQATKSLGDIYELRNELNKAIELYKKVVELDPSIADVWDKLGDIFEKQGNDTKAREYFEKAVEANSKYMSGWVNLSHSYAKDQQWDKALEFIEKAYEIDSSNALILYNLGTAYSEIGRDDDAIEIFEKASKLEPENARVWNNLGNTYNKKQEWEKAIDCFKKAVEFDPNHVRAWNNMEMAYSKLGEKKEAKRCKAQAELAAKRFSFEGMFLEGVQKLRAGMGQNALNQMLVALKSSDDHGFNDLTAKMANVLGNLLDNANRKQDATNYFLMAVDRVKKTNDKKYTLEILEVAGKFFRNNQIFGPAVQCFLDARVIFREFGNEDQYAMYTIEAANCMQPSDDRAIQLLNEAKKHFFNKEDMQSLGMANAKLGMFYLTRKEYKEALVNLQAAEKNWVDEPTLKAGMKLEQAIKSAKDSVNRGKAINYKLNIPRPPNRVQKTPHAKEIFKIFMTELVNFDKSKGIQKLSTDGTMDSQEVIDMFNNAHLLPLTDEDRKEKAEIVAKLADLEKIDRLYLNAFQDYTWAYSLLLQGKHYKEAKKMMKKIEDTMRNLQFNPTEMQISFLNNVAISLTELNPEKAIEISTKGYDYANTIKNSYFMGGFLMFRANAHEKIDQEKAKQDYENSIQIFAELEDNIDLLNVLEKYGTFLQSIGEDGEKSTLKRALEIAKIVEDEEALNRIQTLL